MRIESLEYFIEVTRSGSFTQAANHLFISQQGLSRAIKALEEDLGTVLFKRAGKRVTLTNSGESLLPYAQIIVQSAKDMRKELAGSNAKDRVVETTPVEIIITPFVSNVILNLMTDAVNRWDLAHANFSERNLSEILFEFSSGNLSGSALVLIPENDVPGLMQSKELLFTPLFSLEIMAICPTNLVSPRRKTLTLKELAKLPLAYNSEPVFNRTIQHMTRQTTLENVVLVSSNLLTIDRAVASGRACALSDSLVAYLREAGTNTVTCTVKGAERAYFGVLESKAHPSQHAQRSYVENFCAMINEELEAYINHYPA